MSSNTAFDRAYVETYWEDVPKELYLQVLNTFGAEGRRLCQAARAAAGAQQLSELQHIAHTMRGAAANVGALGLSDRAMSLETAAKESAVSTLPDLLAAFETAWEQVHAEILRLQAERDGP
jgi:HPt (histidine-containing phosphotransfer) domain-containing protein